ADLRHRALARRLVGPEAQQGRAVPEPLARDVVEAHFHHELGTQLVPVALPAVVPAARAARRAAGEALAAFQPLQPRRERRPLGARDRRGEADMIEPSLAVIE